MARARACRFIDVSGGKGIVSAKTYGPDVLWPEHQDKFWKKALAKARRAGWTLTYMNAPHRFGVVSCPAGQHTFDVGKTPRGSERRAREAVREVAKCKHPPQGLVRDRRDRADELLDNAERITLEVTDGLDKVAKQLNAYRLFNELELQLRTASESVREALQAEHEAALEAAVDADDAAPAPDALDGELDTASELVTEGKSVAKSLREAHPGVAKPLLRRIDELHGRIGALRDQLKALREEG